MPLGQEVSHDSEKHSLESGGALPNIILTEPIGKRVFLLDGDDNAFFTATIDGRKRVYRENILPTQISKTLLPLMFAAMKGSGGLPLNLCTYDPQLDSAICCGCYLSRFGSFRYCNRCK